MINYDYLIVGAGFFGSICAHELKKSGKTVCVIEKRNHIGGNCFTENVNGINVHVYGPHIFHTNDAKIWNWIKNFADFKDFQLNIIANYRDKLYPLPFNMFTFNKMWGITDPNEARNIINSQKYVGKINNLEDQALSLVGPDIYNKLIKGYTKKQWKKDPKLLPPSIIKRLPVRFTYNNNYFNDKFQGIPVGGYTQIFKKLLSNIELKLNVDFFKERKYWESVSKKIIYTGPIDKFYDYRFGDLEYKSVSWKNKTFNNVESFQGCPIMNFTSDKIKFTRRIEHKYFEYLNQKDTIVSWEYPIKYERGVEPFYPVNDDQNKLIYNKYKSLSKNNSKYIFGGRLAEYKYYDMHQVIASALTKVKKILKNQC